MKRGTLTVHQAVVSANGCEYRCDFDVFFEASKIDAKLYDANGLDTPDDGSDEIAFLFVTVTSAVNESNSEQVRLTIDESINLDEALIDFCYESHDIQIEAFKQWNNAE
jgi:hypothetical protein